MVSGWKLMSQKKVTDSLGSVDQPTHQRPAAVSSLPEIMQLVKTQLMHGNRDPEPLEKSAVMELLERSPEMDRRGLLVKSSG